MGMMSQQTKLTIVALTAGGLAFLAFSWPNKKALPVVLIVLAIPIALALVSDRSPRIKSFLQKLYAWMFVGIMGLGVVTFVIGFLQGGIPFDVFIVVFVPVVLLIGYLFAAFYLGSLLVKWGKPEAAERLYSFMIRLNLNAGFNYLRRAMLRHNQKDFDRALLDYDMAIKLGKAKAASKSKPPLSVTYGLGVVYANKAEVYLNQHDPQQAVLECNTGLSMNDTMPGSDLILHYKRGYANLLCGNHEAALDDLNSVRFEGKMAVNEKIIGPDVNALKALTTWGLDRHDEAKALWLKATQADANFNNPDWLRDKRRWPDTLVELAAIIQSDLNNTAAL